MTNYMIKYFDENTISVLIRQIDMTKQMDYIYFEREVMDKTGIQRKEFRVKFENEEEETFMYLTDFPFRIEKGYATYDILFQTCYGRFYAHENPKLNSIKLPTIYKTFQDYAVEYKNRPNKEVGGI